MGACIVEKGWKFREKDGIDDISYTYGNIARNNYRASAYLIDEEHHEELAKNADDGVNRLVFQVIRSEDPNLCLRDGICG
jgi:hypothetical protein